MNHMSKWYTIPKFVNVDPESAYHKELEPVMRKEFSVENLHVLVRAYYYVKKKDGEELKDRKYVLRISADDYYKLYVNGVFVAQGPAPSYRENYYYNEIDVTSFLKEGKNVIAGHLYYLGVTNRVYNSGDGRFGVSAEIVEVNTSIGDSLSFKYEISNAFRGDLTGYQVQFLENFDSRLWREDWNLLDFEDSSWEEMCEAPWVDYTFCKQPTKVLDVYEIKPAKVELVERNRWFIDIGYEITGSLLLKAKGRSGQKIEIRCGEELLSANEVRYKMRCNCTYKEEWILAEGICNLEPYDYKGFRYGEVVVEEGVELLEIKALVRHYPMVDNLCILKSDGAYLEDIFRICKHGVRLGTQEAFLDCPTREKGQYLGDAIVTGRSHVWLTGDTDMLRKCIDQFARTDMICKGLMAVAPGSYMQEIADFSLLWSQLLMTDYLFTGDKEFLKQYYPVARNILVYFSKFQRVDGLLEDVTEKWNLVDWPSNLRDDYDFDLGESGKPANKGCHNVINGLFIGAHKVLEKIERILGLPKSFNWQEIYQSYIKAFYREDIKMFADTEASNHCSLHANLFPLYFNFAPMESEKVIADMLVEKGLQCGVMNSYFLLKALVRVGRKEEVYKLLVNESERGWVNMLRDGATACMEAWGKDQKWNTSLVHPWSSSPIIILIEDIGGVTLNPENPKGFEFRPYLPEKVKNFKLRVPFRGRSITVYKDVDGKIRLEETKLG